MRRSGGVALLLLGVVLAQGGKSWGRDVPQNQSESSQLESVRTYAPSDFHQSLLDRLSGGLTQRSPSRLAADSQGRILVTDPALSVVHVFDTQHGKRWQIHGDPRCPLRRPTYIAVDADDNIYVTDMGLYAVFVFQSSGRFLRTIGWGILNVPTGIWVDKPTGTLYVADWWKGQVMSFDSEGRLLQRFGTEGFGPGQLNGPSDVVLHSGILVVLDAGNSRFDLFDLQGQFRGARPFGPNGTPAAYAFDDKENLFYVDLDSGRLIAMDSKGKVLARFGQLPGAGAVFRCVAVDAIGDILALGPALNIETVKLASAASGSAPQ